MRAVYFDGENLLLKNIEEPYPAAHEAKIKLEWAGVCSTDLQILNGYANFTGVIGHEAIGKVVAAPAMPELLGKYVAIEINIGCGSKKCPYCSVGNYKHCPNRKAVGIRGYPGVFSEYFVLPIANLHLLPDGLDPRKAVFAEPLAAALEPVKRNLISQDDKIAVFGVGKLGTLIMLALTKLGFDALGVVRSQERLDFLSEKFPQLKLNLKKRTFGRFDVVIEASGATDGARKALNFLKPQGKLIIKSTIAELNIDKKSKTVEALEGFSAKNLNEIVINEYSIIGSRCGDIEQALEMLSQEDFDPTPLITAQYPLSQAGEAIKRAKKFSGEKVLIYHDTEHPSVK